MWEDIIARKRFDNVTQNLYEHSRNVAQISCATSHFPNTSKLLAYLHDIGKLSPEFQEYIEKGGNRGSVIHAWQGAMLVYELVSERSSSAKLLSEITAFCVTAHHNQLNDGINPDGTMDFYEKLVRTDDGKYSFEEIMSKITEQDRAKLQILFDDAKPEISNLVRKMKEVYKTSNSANFALGLVVKYLFSCLVDADRLDAHLFETNVKFVHEPYNWENLINVFEENISKLSADTKIDKIRKSVSDKCKLAASKETGIYQLLVPTGGGKTYSSFRYALHHCNIHGKKRIIYVIPYLSIIEQTADNLRRILCLSSESDVIFEHHSNIIEPEDEESSEIRKLSSARWDNPIVLTTMVQFLESVMSAKSGKLRKFASMADSVIIFDEIQSIPTKAIHIFNEVVSFLSRVLNSTIILCSATQPTLESTQRNNLLIRDDAKLIDCFDDFKDIERVCVLVESDKDYEIGAEFALERAQENGNCLVIVNTKKSSLEIFNRIKKLTNNYKLFHLSTSMYPVHRADLIKSMKESIKNGERVICVSTQLIEAGVDISFSCVIRAMSGLDSIAQAAGRCNRNGESLLPKPVYTFSLKEENIDKLNDIKSGKEITEQLILNDNIAKDLLGDRNMAEYYKRYFSEKTKQMDYPTPDGNSIYAMLSGNNYGKNNYINRTGSSFPYYFPHAFRSADENFNVIDSKTKSVVVRHGDAIKLIERYRNQPPKIITKEKIKIIKELQKYSVSLYEWQLKELDRQGGLDLLDESTGIIILIEAFYIDDTGVIVSSNQRDFIV